MPEPVALEVTRAPVHTGAWAARLLAGRTMNPMTLLDLHPGDVALAVVAHPDDETLAMGSVVAELAGRGVAVHVVSLSCGDAALRHLGREVPGLGQRRSAELRSAGAALGARSTTALSWPDGCLEQHREDLERVVATMGERHRPQCLLTLWREDPHPDHRSAARAASAAARTLGVAVAELPLWAVHWTDPATVAGELVRMDVTPAASAAKTRALATYSSQVAPLADDLEPVLPAAVIAWPHECVVVA
jgi:LmbE family N-acetylglucosaminyl deacetylase